MRPPLGDRGLLRASHRIVPLMAADLRAIERDHPGFCDVDRHFELRRMGWSWRQVVDHVQAARRAAGLKCRARVIGTNQVVEIEDQSMAVPAPRSTKMSASSFSSRSDLDTPFTVIDGVPDFDGEVRRLAVDLVTRFQGVSIGQFGALVREALALIENRTVVSLESVIIPEVREGSPASSAE